MSSQSEFGQPPRMAVWLITLFGPAGQAESIQGDLLEEFSHVASKWGVAFARRWYWRQTVKTAAHLARAGFHTAPWTIAAAVVGGFLLRWLLSWWSDPAIKGAIESVLEARYRAYEQDPHLYLFWLTNMMLIERLIVNTLIGGMVAVAAKGQEMTATMTLGLAGDVLAIQAVLLTVVKTGDQGVLWTLPHTFACSMAIVAAGATVRTCRSLGTTQPAAT